MRYDSRATVLELERQGILRVEDGNHGEYRPRRDEFCSDGTAFIRAADVNNGVIDFARADRINDVALARIRKGLGRPRDLIFTHKGTVGRVARVQADAPAFVCSPQTTFWRVIDEGRLDRDYLFAFLRSGEFVRQISSRQHESDMAPYVSLTAQRQLEVVLRPIDEQRRIGGIVRSLDDKIGANQRLAGTLEEIAATLFRARFVEFVGVEEFEESEFGPIPQGWRAGRLGDLVDVVMGQSPPGTTYGDEPDQGPLMVQGMSGFGTRFPTTITRTSAPTKLVPAGTALMTVRAPVGQINVAEDEICIGRGVCGLVSDHKTFTEYLARSVSGRWREHESGTIFPAVNGSQIRDLPVVTPPFAAIDEFEDAAAPLMARVGSLYCEAATLGHVRDALLPKLISGQIRVPDTYDPDEVLGPAIEGVAA